MAKRRPPSVNGFVVIDKPAGMTSHDVVAKLRKRFNEKRVGHAGTLDPDATGVLLVGVGYVTRLMTYLSGMSKSYVGEVVLGSTTTTLDDSGETTATFDMSAVTLADVKAAASRFVGEIEQIPPMVSALKVDGKRLHELAREGIEVERKARRIIIHSLAVAPTAEPHVFSIDVTCSSGTYIRTLAADLGAALGGCAHLAALRRTRVGSFTLDEARPLDAVVADPHAATLDLVTMVRDLPTETVDEATAIAVRHGSVFPAGTFAAATEGQPVAVVGDGALLAVYERRGAGIKPVVVVAGSAG